MLKDKYVVPVFDIQNDKILLFTYLNEGNVSKFLTLRFSASALQTGDICLDINRRLVFLNKRCVKRLSAYVL
jgi:hypothetical protein